MTASHRFAVLASAVSAALLLSACQPAAQDTEAGTEANVVKDDVQVTAEESENNDEMDDHKSHDITSSDAAQDEKPMTDILKDYTKSMSDMHNEMMVGMAYNDPDTAFAKAMLGHHRGAVDMAKIELKYGNNEEMLKLAQAIMDSQKLEIDIMKKWLASHPDAPKPKPHTEAMQQAYAKSMEAMHKDMMTGITDPVPDMAFARGMLPHHRGAVDMAIVQLQYGTDEEMRQLAQNIIAAQQPEIEVIQDWITRTSFDAEENDELTDSSQEQPNSL